MTKKQSTRTTHESRKQPRRDERLSVLLVGHADSLSDSVDLLKSMIHIGYEIAVLGAVTTSPSDGEATQPRVATEVWMEEIDKRIKHDPPDVVIQTTDDPELFRLLAHILPKTTRLLDPLALKVVQGLNDVSGELAQTRTKLQSVELIKDVLVSGPEMSLMVLDEDLNVLEINNAILARARLDRSDCIGKPCRWVMKNDVRPDYCTKTRCVAQRVLRSGRPVHTVRQWGSGRGDSYFTVSAYPLGYGENNKKNILIIWKDITSGVTQVLDRQAHDMEENFLATLRQDKMVALGQLATAAVHEINNPIQGILTFAKLMRQAFDKDYIHSDELEKFRSYLDLIADESARCGRILRNLLSFPRLGNLEKTAFDLNPLLDEVFMSWGNPRSFRKLP